MKVVDTLEFLVGTWRVVRSIEDHRTGTRGLFEGTADVAYASSRPDGAVDVRARYEEMGELRFGTHRGQAHRQLHYLRLDDATVMLFFIDGRPFVDLDLTTGAWRSNHPCGKDHYEIATFVASGTVIEERWRVQGPAKNYQASTTLTRMA
ncbi:MAG: DUF6314 family protein [Actinomycetota bacterium]|nr:DUF6314 family protein [Actinomycetota bacterium]